LEAAHTIRHPDYVPGQPIFYETIEKKDPIKSNQFTKLQTKNIRIWKDPYHHKEVTSYPIIT
jgi:hypothetical protein